MNFWTGYGYKWPAKATGPTQRVQPKGAPNFSPSQDVPGDGVSMYPGPSPSQPLSSVRLEIMRDGEEDYEYLVLLDKLIRKAEARGESTPALREARIARGAARRLVPGLTRYERDPDAYLDVRERVGDAIEGLL